MLSLVVVEKSNFSPLFVKQTLLFKRAGAYVQVDRILSKISASKEF